MQDSNPVSEESKLSANLRCLVFYTPIMKKSQNSPHQVQSSAVVLASAVGLHSPRLQPLAS